MMRPRLLVLLCVAGLLHLGAVVAGAVALHDRIFATDALAGAKIVYDGEEAPLADDGDVVAESDDVADDVAVQLLDEVDDATDDVVAAAALDADEAPVPSLTTRSIVLPVEIISTR